MGLLIAATLALGTVSASAEASAPVTPVFAGDFTLKIYQSVEAESDRALNDPLAQALATNPLLGPDGPEPIATLSFSGNLGFEDPIFDQPDPNNRTIGDFLGDLPGLDYTVADRVRTKSGRRLITLFEFTFTAGPLDGFLDHDDGIGLYLNDELVTPEAKAAPTGRTITEFETFEGGPYRLIFLAADGSPEFLYLRATGPAEETPDFAGFGCRIDLAQTGLPDSFRYVLPASDSAKFCPTEGDNRVRLRCSGTLPGYATEVELTFDEGVQCRISGSQCGIDQVLDADVTSIRVDGGGFVELECAASQGSGPT